MVVNLYPFYAKVTSAGGIDFDDGIENIDIGGPAMIRAAAKVIYYSLQLVNMTTLILYFYLLQTLQIFLCRHSFTVC